MIPDLEQPPVSTPKSAAREAVHSCEDCGDRATQQTADGVWLCEGDFELLLDASIWNQEGDRL